MSVHLLPTGGWAECPDEGSCALLFHVPGMSVAEAASLPERVLYPLLEVVQPPSRIRVSNSEGHISRLWEDARGERHRDYDLPAIIRADGTREWWRNGYRHRDGDLPAVVRASGTREWYHHGNRHRGGDLPAIINADGMQAWYRVGFMHRDAGLPAYVDMEGHEEWWIDGKKIDESS